MCAIAPLIGKEIEGQKRKLAQGCTALKCWNPLGFGCKSDSSQSLSLCTLQIVI